MEINVEVHPDLATALHGRKLRTSELEDLRRRLDELGVSLQAVHPGEDDPLLSSHFTVQVTSDDEELAARVLAVLEESAAVEAAYVKPLDELP